MKQSPLEQSTKDRSPLRAATFLSRSIVHGVFSRTFAGVVALWAVIALTGALAGQVAAQERFPSGRDGGAFAIRNVRVFDGSTVLQSQTVLIRDGRIQGLGDRLVFPENTPIVDGTGHTLMPGLIDAHTHTFDRRILVAALNYGVTTELDQFTATSFAAAMRAEQDASDVWDRADLFSAGTLATDPRGHGTQFGLPIPTITGPDEAADFVAARKAEGSDWLKIVWEDGSNHGMELGSLSAESVGALVRAATANDLRSFVHVSKMSQAFGAARFGATGLVHAPYDLMPEPGAGRVLAEAGIFMAPTLTIIRSIATGVEGEVQLGDERLAEKATGSIRVSLETTFPVREKTASSYEYAKELTRQMHEAGGVLLAGTDAPNPGTGHGLSMHRELELLVEAGLTPTDALTAATSSNADAFGLDDRGRIAPGLRADLVLMEGDPTTNITDTRNLIAIWRNGAWVEPLAEAPTLAAGSGPSGAGGSVPGLISDFDDGTIESSYGAGWMPSTDQLMGGSSVVELELEEGALTLEGEVIGGGFTTWSGANFFPADRPMQPFNASAGTGLRFRARGEGTGLSVMVFAESLGQIPAIVQRALTAEWSTVEIPFSEFSGADPAGMTGLFIGQAGQAGVFRIQIDDVEIY